MKILSAAQIFVFLTIISIFTANLFGQDKNEDDEIATLLKEGTQYFNAGDLDASRIAFEKFSAVLEKCQNREIKECEALTLNYLGQISLRENEKAKAVDFFNRALPAFRSIKKKDSRFDNLEHQILLGLGAGYAASNDSERALKYFDELLTLLVKRNDTSGQATILAYLGNVYQSLKQKDKALENYRKSLKMFQVEQAIFPAELLYKNWELVVLDSIAILYSEYGDVSECLEYNQKILEIQKNQNDLKGAAMTLNNMHMISAAAGKSAEAFKYLDEAVAISRTLHDKNLETYILSFAVSTNFTEGEVTKAMELARQILPVMQAQNDLPGQARLLGYIGGTYLHLGNYSEAINYYERALPIYQSEGCVNSALMPAQSLINYCREGRIAVVTGLGKAYNGIGRKDDGLRILETELGAIESEREETSSDQYKGMLLNAIGQIYLETNQNEKAIKYFSQALPLINSRNSRAKSSLITDIGKAQANSANKAEARLSYNQALLLLTPFVKNLKKGKEESVGYTFANLMFFFKFENPKAAVFFGKKAVDAYQKNRENVKDLDKETQKAYLKSIEFTYRSLSELLLEQNRLPEAQQILNSFKDQQFFDFDQSRQKPFAPLTLTLREADLTARYEQANESVGKIDSQIEELRGKIDAHALNAEETARLQKLESDLKTAADNFSDVFKQAEAEFSKPTDEKDKVGETSDLKEMQAALRETSVATKQSAVAVYTLVGEDNFRALIVTSDCIKSVSTPIKNTSLNDKAKQYWALLQSSNDDPTILGKELYNIVFKPIEKELPVGTKTILWSLDGNLRYIPMAALYDGKQYLVERYQNVIFTRADEERMTRNISPVWTGTGFGTSEAHTVKILDDEIPFVKLDGVKEELKSIFRTKETPQGILEGDFFLDVNPRFDKQTMIDALKLHRPVVHIASHFSFRPGDEARSFLLLGDGTAMTLEEMKRQNDLFAGVELLTLSACKTAAQQPNSSGREIDAFFELAQRLGANAVLASLWSVGDNSTSALMKDFYDLKLNKKLSKAKALQQAQLSMLNGNSESKNVHRKQKRRDDSPDELTPYQFDKNKPFAHPYFWAPFVLIGNWR